MPFPNKDKINHPCPLTLALDAAMLEAKAMTFRTPGRIQRQERAMVHGRWSSVFRRSMKRGDARLMSTSPNRHSDHLAQRRQLQLQCYLDLFTSAFFAFPTGTPTKVRRRTRPTSFAPSNFSQANWSFEVLVVRQEVITTYRLYI